VRLKNDPSPWEQVRVIANVARKSMRTAATAMNHCAGPRTTHDMDIAVTPGTGDAPRLRARFEPGGCVTGRLGAETCSPPRVTPPTRSTRKSANGPGPGTTRRPSIRPRSTGSFDGCTDPARARSGLAGLCRQKVRPEPWRRRNSPQAQFLSHRRWCKVRKGAQHQIRKVIMRHQPFLHRPFLVSFFTPAWGGRLVPLPRPRCGVRALG
jgi:hypothetical protein